MKRILTILLVLAMLPVPAAFAARNETPVQTISQAAYATVEADVWDAIETLEDTNILARKGPSATADDYAALVDDVVELVESSQTYAEDTMIRNGNFVAWQTTEGVACGYSPALRAKLNGAEQTETKSTTSDIVALTSGVKNSPGTDYVSVIQPYYGIDSSFTTQYVDEAQSIINTLGSSGKAYYREGASIDNIADAVERSAVVLLDSHGDTDYYTSYGDYTSRANTSYVCLQTGTGLTTADYAVAYGTYGSFYHAYYGGSNGSMKIYCVDGTTIASHMDQQAPNSLFWTAICLGMATDGLHKPLMSKGVGVAYGYSQSVTFVGDYLWESAFWSAMKSGYTVADAITYMKSVGGSWDLSPALYDYYNYYYDSDTCYTASQARNNYSAFPIVVSAQDAYPGHGNVDYVQSVYSNWTLWNQTAACNHSNTTYDYVAPTCTTDGYEIYWCSTCGTQLSYNYLPALGHSFQSAVTPPTCSVGGRTDYWCTRCGYSYQDNWTGTTSHFYRTTVITAPTATTAGLVQYTCKNCGYSYTESVPAGTSIHVCPSDAFVDLDNRAWYHEGVDYVLNNGLFNGVGKSKFEPDSAMTRAMLVTVLWRQSGEPTPRGSNQFSDVRNDYWYTNAITWAAENEIVNGVGKGKFEPDESITREQMATVLFRYCRYSGLATGARADLSGFPDAAQVDTWAADALSWAYASGLITGSKEGSTIYLLPLGSATRAQVATILMRFNRLNTEIQWFSGSTYKVGTDIPAGFYYCRNNGLRKDASILVSSKSDFSDSLLDSIFKDFDFVTLNVGEYVFLDNVKMTLAANIGAPVVSPTNGVYPAGTYRIGEDIPTGVYSATVTESCYIRIYTDYTRREISKEGYFGAGSTVTITVPNEGRLLFIQGATFVKLS